MKVFQVTGRRKYRQKKDVPEFTSNRDERLKMLVNSRKRNFDSTEVTTFRRAVSMQITADDE